MATGRRIAATFLAGAALAVAAGTSAGALTLPSATTPTVSTPSVTTPSVSTPVGTAPTVTVPKATTPTVKTPKVTTPKVTTPPSGGVPKVSPPKLTTPKVTVAPVTAPKVNTPKAAPNAAPKAAPKPSTPGIKIGGGGSGGGGSGGGGGVTKLVPSSTGLVAVPDSGTAGQPTAGGSGGQTTSGNGNVSPVLGGGPGGPAGPGGTGGPGGSVGAFLRAPAGLGVAANDPFAVAVASLAGCFYALSPFEQQVLTVRTGIDGRQPLSRDQLATVLGVTPAALGRTERTALGQLRTASRSDGCMPVATISTAHALTAFVGGPFGPIGVVTPALAPTSRAEPGTGGSATPSSNLASSSTPFGERLARLDGDGGASSLWVVLLITVLLSGALAALARETRRSF
jgi:hypothetical protein